MVAMGGRTRVENILRFDDFDCYVAEPLALADLFLEGPEFVEGNLS